MALVVTFNFTSNLKFFRKLNTTWLPPSLASVKAFTQCVAWMREQRPLFDTDATRIYMIMRDDPRAAQAQRATGTAGGDYIFAQKILHLMLW